MILLFLLRFAGQLFGPIISILESGIVNPVTLVKLNVVTLLMSYKYTHTHQRQHQNTVNCCHF